MQTNNYYFFFKKVKFLKNAICRRVLCTSNAEMDRSHTKAQQRVVGLPIHFNRGRAELLGGLCSWFFFKKKEKGNMKEANKNVSRRLLWILTSKFTHVTFSWSVSLFLFSECGTHSAPLAGNRSGQETAFQHHKCIDCLQKITTMWKQSLFTQVLSHHFRSRSSSSSDPNPPVQTIPEKKWKIKRYGAGGRLYIVGFSGLEDWAHGAKHAKLFRRTSLDLVRLVW